MTLPAPYPADTRAKGWRFEIDYEKVEELKREAQIKYGMMRF